MKKINSLLIGVSILFAGFFTTSCNKDTTSPDPTIVASLNGVVQDAVTVTSGSSVSYQFQILAPAKIKSIQITKKVGSDISTILNKTSDFLKDTFDIINNSITVSANTELTVTVIDKNDISVSKIVDITVGAAAGNITSYTAKLIGAENNSSVGSAFSTSSGSVYNQAQAVTNSTSVDFLYFFSSTAGVGSEIISPLYGSTNWSSYVTWSNPNSTKFAKTTAISASEFDAMTDDSKITSIVSTITWNTDERVVSLAVGDIFAFKTATGKYGLTKVTALTAGATGSITISVNVQQ